MSNEEIEMAGALSVVRAAISGNSVEKIEAELARLNAQGAALVDEIDRLAAAEDDAEEPAAVGAATNATRAAKNKLRKLDTRIAETRERLADARDTARARRRADLLAACAPAAKDLLAKARAAQEAATRYIAAREALDAHGFGNEYRAQPIPPLLPGGSALLLAPDLLDRFEEALQPALRRVVLATPGPARKPGAESQHLPHQPVSHFRPGETTAGVTTAPQTATRRSPLRETAGDGESLFAVVRGVVEVERKGTLSVGDVVALTPIEAQPLLRKGVITDHEETAP